MIVGLRSSAVRDVPVGGTRNESLNLCSAMPSRFPSLAENGILDRCAEGYPAW